MFKLTQTANFFFIEDSKVGRPKPEVINGEL